MYKSVSAYNLKGAYALGTALGGDGGGGGLQKSYTVGNCVVEKKRGFKPSDRHDPVKKQFLTELSKQIWQKTDESSNVSKKVDLHKIFTPATDAEEILPKNRKLYASSAFYSPTLHPTVEDQVELARRISHSLSDISNQKSKGQSMYVNRKKRSVKWVHEGSGQDYHQYQPKPPTSPSLVPAYSDAGKHRVQLNMHQEQLLEKYAKPGLKVVKTPWEAALETGSASAAFVEEPKLSPHHTPTPTLSPAPAPQYHDMKRGGSPYVGAAPTVTDGGVGGAYSGYSAPTLQQKPPQAQFPASKPISIGSNYQRDLAYKPSLPQGWKAPSMSLPKELYIPKEIPLESYAPPPAVNIKPQSYESTWQPPSASPAPYGGYQYGANRPTPASASTGFPLSKPSSGGFSTPAHVYGRTTTPPKQQYWEPTSYQTVPPQHNQAAPQVSFNPSPLPYDKLAKFEGAGVQEATPSSGYSYSPQPRQSRLAVQGHGALVRNSSPTPFGSAGAGKPARYSPAVGGSYGATYGSDAQRPPSQQYSNYSNESYEQASTPSSTRFNTSELLHSQNFNSSARGWRAGAGSSAAAPACGGAYNAAPYRSQPKTLVSAGHLPYTDF